MNTPQYSSRLVVTQSPAGEIRREFQQLPLDPSLSNQVRVRLDYTAINFKDALALSGNRGVIKKIPIVPGIDAVGHVLSSSSEDWRVGQQVFIQHSDFGTAVDGGFQQVVDVPEDWVYSIPDGLTGLETVTLGTAGFTAAQCCQALLASGLHPEDGELVVSGSTGGVGVFSVMLLHKLNYNVVAATGKADRVSWLKDRGAQRVIDRQELVDTSNRPLLSARWAGAVDTVGGATLSTIVRSTQPHRTVTACGLVGGTDLNLTVYPFILRGISLIGIDSALISREYRNRLWQRLGSDWRIPNIDDLATIISPQEIEHYLEQLLQGKVVGRIVIDLNQLPRA